jgi:hypothetical protein
LFTSLEKGYREHLHKIPSIQTAHTYAVDTFPPAIGEDGPELEGREERMNGKQEILLCFALFLNYYSTENLARLKLGKKIILGLVSKLDIHLDM